MFRRVVIVALALGLLAPATASAARPAVTTGGVANLTPTHRVAERQGGSERARTRRTSSRSARRGSTARKTPDDRRRRRAPTASGDQRARRRRSRRRRVYHYRLVALNADGTTLGQGPHVQDEGAAARRDARGDADHGRRPAAPTTLAGPAHRHEQREPPGPAARRTRSRYTAGFATVGNAAGDRRGRQLLVHRASRAGRRRSIRVQMPAKPEVIEPDRRSSAPAVQVKTDTKKVDRGRAQRDGALHRQRRRRPPTARGSTSRSCATASGRRSRTRAPSTELDEVGVSTAGADLPRG